MYYYVSGKEEQPGDKPAVQTRSGNEEEVLVTGLLNEHELAAWSVGIVLSITKAVEFQVLSPKHE